MDKVQPDVAILNTQVNPFEWTVSANLINNYMIVAFGKYGYFCFIIFNINN